MHTTEATATGPARPSPTRRTSRHRGAWAVVAVAALLVASCSSDDGDDASTAGPTTTTTGGAGDPAAFDVDGRSCDQGASSTDVEVEPVEGVVTDHTLTSFDGTEVRMHWFPTDAASEQEPAPTILMGPGWGQPGDTTMEGAPLFGALSIGGMNEAGYHVLTWDPRGFGESTGEAAVNAADTEGRDVQLLLDWVAEQPTARTDAEGDPRVGMVGFSYGGGIQLTVAAADCRVDALVPGIAWSSLESSLYKSGIVKQGWASTLVNSSAAGRVDPHVTSAADSGEATGTIDAEDEAWFVERGPGEAVADIAVPTLLVHGTVDTLFTPTEAVTNLELLADSGAPTAMLWFCGGHGTCLTHEPEMDWVSDATFAWLDRYVMGDESVDTGPGFRTVDQDGTVWAAKSYPEADAELTGSGSGTLALTEASAAGPATAPDFRPDLLTGLVLPITPARADEAVEVTVEGPDEAAMVLGAPKLSITYSGEAPDGERPTRVFAQVVDDDGLVLGNQITPVVVELDGQTHTVEVDLEVVAQRLEPGDTLTVQLVATTVAYATPRLGGEITFDEITVSLPLVTEGLSEA